MTTPHATVTVGGNDVSSDVQRIEVILRENAVSNAVIVLVNEQSRNYLDTVNLYDTVRIDLRNRGSVAREVFGGYLTKLRPTAKMGLFCSCDCLGFGVALKRMRVAHEYGSESGNPTLDTAREIITDATDGLVPRFVNQVLDTATASGYALQTASGGDNYVYDEATVIPYLNYPYAPVIDALKDICDLTSANNYASEGTHWTVVPKAGVPYLCFDVVANHHAPITDLWPNASPAGTLTQGDEIETYEFWKAESEGNYVVYYGNFEKPTAERWTEGANVHTSWGFSLGAGSSPAGIVGSQCVMCTGAGGSFYYPGAGTLGLNITTIETVRTIPRISFYLRRNANVTGVLVELTTSAGNYYYHNVMADLPNAGEWRHFTLPVGNYCNQADWIRNFNWSVNGAPNWNAVNYVWFVFVGAAGSTLEVDDLQFHGGITRAAKSNAAITAQKGKVKFIHDDIGKDDTLTASDAGVMAQLAKAELIRSMTTPIVGVVTIPLYESVMAGQIQHAHAEEKKDGSFNVDSDFRITSLKHTLFGDGGFTELTLTDDVVNGYPMSPMNAINLLLRTVNPDFQDRDRGSIKGRGVDLLQTVLEVNY